MSKKTLLLGGVDDDATTLPKSVDFDGTNDYLSRSSDLTGNADGKTFTFSCWVYRDGTGSLALYAVENFNFMIYGNSSQTLLVGRNTSSSNILYAEIYKPFPYRTWAEIIISVNLTNPSDRHIYRDDIDETTDWTWTTYANDSINFTSANHTVGNNLGNSRLFKGRLSNLFLDYTYRDLSVAANRRKFTTFDAEKGLVPAEDQAVLNPIIYLPFDNPATSHVNLGSGGNFVQNGTIARSNRASNQYNAVASEFDGSADSLTSTNIGGAVDNKLFTCSFKATRRQGDGGGDCYVFYQAGAAGYINITNSNNVQIRLENLTAGTVNCQIRTQTTSFYIADGAVFQYDISLDFTDQNKSKIQINGVSQAISISKFNDVVFEWNNGDWYVAAKSNTAEMYINLGELYLTNEYIDLSTNNPFWDSTTNKPKYLGESGELPTGSSPLIYLPLRADDAGNNLGAGGDFTVNSGPFAGARGGSEYWARSAVVDGSKYLTGSVVCASLVKWKSTNSGATWTVTYANSVTVTKIGNGTDNGVVAYYFGTSENINWALESNKLRFTDGLGYPIPPVIDTRTVLFLDFANLSNFGLNQGTGGNFTQTGTIIAGADVNV